ncbi:hypothetical protein BKA70DRAFT_1343946 [Coprinopsis sp. MPI-PUGE-AT-0042]|nr:hypothetical protein BKA70DRAFT_1343946 [Coprinopsis sp. MPI-PUGE-AT-0042]
MAISNSLVRRLVTMLVVPPLSPVTSPVLFLSSISTLTTAISLCFVFLPKALVDILTHIPVLDFECNNTNVLDAPIPPFLANQTYPRTTR